MKFLSRLGELIKTLMTIGEVKPGDFTEASELDFSLRRNLNARWAICCEAAFSQQNWGRKCDFFHWIKRRITLNFVLCRQCSTLLNKYRWRPAGSWCESCDYRRSIFIETRHHRCCRSTQESLSSGEPWELANTCKPNIRILRLVYPFKNRQEQPIHEHCAGNTISTEGVATS
jgi:hypothetical protein